MAAVLVLSVAIESAAEQVPIIMDGLLDDWGGVAVAYDDPAGDGGASGIDLGRLWVADDQDFLFLRFELGTEVDLSENNNLVLYLDTDANSATGLSVAGLGAELEWRYGDRAGTFYYQAQSTTVYQWDLDLRGGPTVSATEFEFGVGRHALPDDVHPLFTGSVVRIALLDAGGDQLPDAGDTVSYTFDQGQLPPETVIPFAPDTPADLRVVTYNVLTDGPWVYGIEPRFGRQFAAVVPDIVNLQEVYNHSAADAADLVGRWVDPEPGDVWYAAGNADCKTVSRYPILGSWGLDGNLAVLIDTTPVLGSQLLVINAHLPCCENDASRQAEVDRIMAFIRDAKQPGGALTLASDTPIMVTGDLNLVGLAQQLTTLLTGDIVNPGFGPDFTPDWDGTDLADLISRLTERRMGYTWRDSTTYFWPGHLDYFIYTDHVLDVGNHFVISTQEMSAESLDTYGLLAIDSRGSDHLLVCADFRPPGPIPGDLDDDGDVDLNDFAAFAACLGGPDVAAPPPSCDPMDFAGADLDGDNDVDLTDFAAFAVHFTG
jgi:hypothetical protein